MSWAPPHPDTWEHRDNLVDHADHHCQVETVEENSYRCYIELETREDPPHWWLHGGKNDDNEVTKEVVFCYDCFRTLDVPNEVTWVG